MGILEGMHSLLFYHFIDKAVNLDLEKRNQLNLYPIVLEKSTEGELTQ